MTATNHARGVAGAHGIESQARVAMIPPVRAGPLGAPLPVSLSSFVARERELAEVAELLRRDEVRLLTLTGPGGAGKTRMALRVAEELVADFPGGVVFVALAGVVDASFVLPAVAHAVGVRGWDHRDPRLCLRSVSAGHASGVVGCGHLLRGPALRRCA